MTAGGREDSTDRHCWTTAVRRIRTPLLRGVRSVAVNAAQNPWRYVAMIPFFSIVLFAVGFSTRFHIVVDGNKLWATFGSRPSKHSTWIENESGFPKSDRRFSITVHSGGNNVLSVEGMRRCFDALDTLTHTYGYNEICRNNKKGYCPISSPTEFWGSNHSMFIGEVGSDEDTLIDSLSAFKFSNDVPVIRKEIFGWSKPQVPQGDAAINMPEQETRLTSVQAYMMRVGIPPEPQEAAEIFEADALLRLKALRKSWESEGSEYHVEFFAGRSFADEFSRAIEDDIVLIPMVFVIMTVFCCAVFSRRSIVHSRTALGCGAVVTVLLALCCGYGMMFLSGVPFTSLAQIFPFILFGIGLDDAFIITGSFDRTDLSKPVVERVADTIDDIGGSVLVTTMTTFVAFALGLQSTIPAIHGFCMYAFPCVMINFLYQITFFVALVVLDENRRIGHRMDWLCCVVKSDTVDDDNDNTSADGTAEARDKRALTTRVMDGYCDILMKPVTKVGVIAFFLGLVAMSAYSTSFLRQAFDFLSVLPSDSYVRSFFGAQKDLTEQLTSFPGIYFRNVDQSNPYVQEQMMTYVKELAETDYFNDEPPHFWLRDFLEFEETIEHFTNRTEFDSLSFHEKIEIFLEDPVYAELYDSDIVRINGEVTATRTWIALEGSVMYGGVKDQINALKAQDDISRRQPLNEGQSEWALFTFSTAYFFWDFYAVAVRELISTTIMGVVAVAVIAALFVPHPRGILWVTPILSMVYIDLLGLVQVTGFSVNPTLYIGMVMSIGLVVDYLMHFVSKYFESTCDSPEERIREVLKTVGVSVALGGVSTLLGVVPLAFAASEIFRTIFVVFIGIVVLGLAQGLVLMPVILSIRWSFPPLGGARRKKVLHQSSHVAFEKENGNLEEEKREENGS